MYGNTHLQINKQKVEFYFNDIFSVFAHCASSDFDHPRHMIRGVSVKFANFFGKPHKCHQISLYLCKQIFPTTKIYTLLTKENYYSKPSYEKHNQAIRSLEDSLIRNKDFSLTIPPIGMNRDKIPVRVGALAIFKNLISRGVSVRVCATDYLYDELVNEFLNINLNLQNSILNIYD